ncbi:hypothetical protein NX059_007768 [Plenodomus lindquistii]|nr:hypothetical protein NX059_007768 [Plenodomus lindquistii]
MLSLPLAKLSVALDTAPDAQNFTWQHETRNLSFVIDTYGGNGSSQLLKVVQGTQVKQLIEIERLILEGNETMRVMQQRGVSLKAEQLPISAIVRCPLLAIHWQLPNQMVRRAQIKFKSSQDYDVAYNQLHLLGLRMTPSNDTRPCTPSNPSQPSPLRPSSAATTHSDHTSSGGLSCPPSHLAGIASRPFTASDVSAPMHAQLQEDTRSRPFSALPGHSHADHAVSGPMSGPLTPPVYFARPSSATTDTLQQSSTGTGFSVGVNSFTPSLEDVSRPSSGRIDGSVRSPSPLGVEPLLPPRRELPFQRVSTPLSSGSDTVRPPSRPSTSLMGPPPLPDRVNSLRPSSARDNVLETELSQLPQPTIVARPGSRQSSSPKPPRTPDTSHNITSDSRQDAEHKRPSSSSPATNSSPSLAPLQRPNSALSPLRLGTPPGGTLQSSRRASLMNSPATPPTSDALPHHLSVPSVDNAVNDSEKDGLRAYVMQSEDGRRAALNEFIFRHLESDDFLTLVEDLETCWARSALGMR